MNFSFILYMLTRVIQFEGVFLLIPCITSLVYGESAGIYYAIVMAVCFLIGVPGMIRKPKNRVIYSKEGYLMVAFSWIVISLVGAVPLWICGDIPSYVDALFEIVSGFTTTGASILTNVEGLTHTSLIWRCFSNWIGGMGVLVFIMAILPLGGSYNLNIMKAESPGPSVDKMVPRVSDTAKVLYAMYICLTIVEVIILLVQGMPVFDAINTAFATAGTGGFGIKNDSFAGYTGGLQITVAVFMILFGVNFSVYFLLIRGFKKILRGKARFKDSAIPEALKHEEMLWYFAIILGATGLITWQVFRTYDTPFEGLRHAFFQVASIISTTGFSTTDYNVWSEPARCVIILLMFFGACAGSTGGGIKVSRIVIWFKSLDKEIRTFLHPSLVRKTTFNGRRVEHETVRAINVFMVAYALVFIVSMLIVSFDEFGFTTSFSSVLSAMGNIGPGLDVTGPCGNYAAFSDLSKFVLMFDMLAGRLELFPLLILFSPVTWFRK